MSIANTTLGTGWSPGSPNKKDGLQKMYVNSKYHIAIGYWVGPPNKKGGLGNLSLASDPLLLRLVRPLCVNEY